MDLLEGRQFCDLVLHGTLPSGLENVNLPVKLLLQGIWIKAFVSGFRLNVDYLDFGSAFNTLTFKIINASETLSMSWEIIESLNWLTITPNSGNLQGGQEVTLTVTVDRSLLSHTTTGNVTIHSADMEMVLPVSVSL